MLLHQNCLQKNLYNNKYKFYSLLNYLVKMRLFVYKKKKK